MSFNKAPDEQHLNKNVCVIGGGIAGLSAAVFLSKNNFRVTLIESSPRLGGRAYSFFDKNINEFIDNGQHIMASWYENTFEFLKIIGTFDRLTFQDQLKVKFIDSDGTQFTFKCPKLPPPFHLIWGLFTYKPLKWKDKLGIIRLMKSIRSKKFSDKELKNITISELFEETKQSKRVINYFWKPFIIAVFNAQPDETNAWNFVKIIEKGFLQKNGSNLVLSKSNLNLLYVNASEEYFKKNGVNILTSTNVVKLNFSNDRVNSIIIDNGDELNCDFVISAVPYYELSNLIGAEKYEVNYSSLKNLTYSPIVNIYHVYELNNGQKIISDDFAGLLNSMGQWIFKINDLRVCIVISSAKDLVTEDKELIIEKSREELRRCIPAFKNVKFTYSKVVKEKRATFLPDVRSVKSRPGNTTIYENFFIAGDWTDTGYPATIESAVTSSKNCVSAILKQLK